MKTLPSVEGVRQAATRLDNVIRRTPWEFNKRLSAMTDASVFIKREDLQQIRSFKIRGAYNKISSLTKAERTGGIVCASAGNHAQGFAFSCQKLQIQGDVYMPATTPQQKVSQVRMFGGEFIEIVLTGDTYDACQKHALKASKKQGKTFIHPFDDKEVIEGQATMALEILNQSSASLDYILVPVGGGGLISGIITVMKSLSPKTKIIGVEPQGAPSMQKALEAGQRISLKKMDRFVDGAAVRQVGELPFEICKSNLSEIITVAEGQICQTILDLYNKEGIVAEPAGALALAGLEMLKTNFKGKRIAVLLCGGNNDILRMPEISERALLYANLKHYFLIDFPQRAGALKEFVTDILGPNDDITHFEFSKKSYRTNASAVVGIQLKEATDFSLLVERMKIHNFKFDYLNEKQNLFQFLI
ncbi:MAG: threonine ammonia-lyase IlvA [Flavobacteriaceae bacterium]|nr:threonine ammonia-lyase IlvA [Flavobacteriaceae bacterium]MDG2387031.1 threonine ammonia-lyase IlvA [Flavobacteriaceae bacterium]